MRLATIERGVANCSNEGMGKSLFEGAEQANRRKAEPLAARMRPRSLAEFVGQQQFLGEGKLLRRLLKADRLG
ncbi:MAG: hypothetical protein ACREHD_16415, partial [Pirellulales bacterium]